MEVRGIRRSVKNVAHNYTEPQRKVREATCNEPWGPSNTIMNEIADLSYTEAFEQIMEMLWKRLNDHGKNWRHVYKALVVMDYLIKVGSERVGQRCKENIYAIQTLKDFQHYESGKDVGLIVRDKAKALVTLLTSEEKLGTERAKALNARNRFAQATSGFGSSELHSRRRTSNSGHAQAYRPTGFDYVTSTNTNNPEIESIRPHNPDEEDAQLQIALAMSKEDAEQEEQQKRNYELKLQMALAESERVTKSTASAPAPPGNQGALVDLLDVDFGAGASAVSTPGLVLPPPAVTGSRRVSFGSTSTDQWNLSLQQQQPITNSDPWAPSSTSTHLGDLSDPWSSLPQSNPPPSQNNDPWNTNLNPIVATGNDPWYKTNPSNTNTSQANYLGESGNTLVNLDNLLPTSPNYRYRHTTSMVSSNPFVGVNTNNPSAPPIQSTNPFQIHHNMAKPRSANGFQ